MARVDITGRVMKRQRTSGGRFRIRRLSLNDNGFRYVTHQVVGYLNGERVRRKFKSRDEAVGERDRLEVQAANAEGNTVRPVNTRLSSTQIATAETLFALTPDPLAAVRWYLGNFRPPCVEKPLCDAKDAFLAALKPEVELVHYNDVDRRLTMFCDAFSLRMTGSLTTSDIGAYLNGRGWAPKTFNNVRGVLHGFFDFCAHKDRRWTESNPVGELRQKKVARGLPRIETAEKIAELFRFLERYAGGPRKPKKPGFLVPYFALATFAGMRPAIPGGEIWKLAHSPNLNRLLNFETGVIHVPPEIAKTDDIRQIKIRPNLERWLRKYPLADYPIVMPNMQALVTDVRKQFGLSDDVLRHTWISAHVAAYKSIGEAAIEAGNSESIIRAHYLNVMSESEANAFFAIVPAL